MSSDKRYMARVQSVSRYYASGLYRELSEKNVFLFAQAIAFKVLVTIVPIVILLMGILGDILGQQEPFSAVSHFVRGFLPPSQSDQLLEFLGAFHGSSGAFLSVGTIGLLVTAMTLATTMRVAVSSAFAQDWNEERTILGGYAFDLRMVGQVGLLFLLTVALSFLVQALNAEGQQLIRQIGLERWFRTGWRQVFNVLSLMVPLLVSTTMFFQLFYFIPIPHPPKTSAAVGAFITALLWEVAKYGFAFYATYVGTFRYESASDGMAALSNSFGLIIAFVLWVYYSGIVLMVGAVLASLHEERQRTRAQDEAFAGRGSKLDAASHMRLADKAPEGEDDSDEDDSDEDDSDEDDAASGASLGAVPARADHRQNSASNPDGAGRRSEQEAPSADPSSANYSPASLTEKPPSGA